MRKVRLCIIVVISMLLNPAAHAAGYCCCDRGGDRTELLAKSASGAQHEKGKLSSAAHHCICSHATTHKLEHAAPLPFEQAASLGIFSVEGSLGSVVVGPPLQPPSFA